MAAALFLEPAAPMPVPSQIGSEPRNHNHVADTRFDPGVAARTNVRLAGLVWLYRVHGRIAQHQPKNPHATNASVSTTNTTTSMMSAADRF